MARALSHFLQFLRIRLERDGTVSKLHIYLKIRTKSNKMPIIYKIMLDKFGLN